MESTLISDLYAAIDHAEDLDIDFLRKFFSSAGTPERASFIISHLLHETAMAVVRGRAYIPKHLVIPFVTESSDWLTVAGQVQSILS